MAFLEGVTVLMDRRKLIENMNLPVISLGRTGTAGGSVRAAEGVRVGRTGPPAAWNSVSQFGRERLWFKGLRSHYETESGPDSVRSRVRPRGWHFVS